MSISRDTFNLNNNYKLISFHQDRDLLDSELNEMQDLLNLERKKIGDTLFKEGAIVSGLGVTIRDNVLNITGGQIYIDGHLETVPGAVLSYPTPATGADYVYLELLKYNYSYTQDSTLINPATGEPTAEREKWVLALKTEDTSSQALPNNVTARKVIPIYKFDRDNGTVTPTVLEKSNLYLKDFLGTLPGSRITVSSISEDQLSFAAAEGLNSLLQNMAERTFDQAGSYLVNGFDSFIGNAQEDGTEVITNAGRAYIQGFRHQRDLPTSTAIPKSIATKSVRGEQKTFNPTQRRYPVNSTPLKSTTQLEAIVVITASVTRGSVAGGEDLLDPNPVVEILEVSQGAIIYAKGKDWQQSGNQVDWLGSGKEPAIGTTYTVRWSHTRQMVKGVDYIDGGWFGQDNHPEPATYYYLVTAYNNGTGSHDENEEQLNAIIKGGSFFGGETAYAAELVVSKETSEGEINHLSWQPVSSASGYRVYRAVNNDSNTDFLLIKELGSDVLSYIDDGVDEAREINPPEKSSFTPPMSQVVISRGNCDVINFGRTTFGVQPVAGSNCSIDYDYFLGRKDIIYATNRDIKRLEGAAGDFPKLPVVPEGTLGLCSIDCPPNSTDIAISNFGLKRITMDRIHDIISDIEDLKYNDAQYQITNQLQNREAQTKKGIYSDDFSSSAQSDTNHAEWDARINEVDRFAAPNRTAASILLEADKSSSNVTFCGSLALLPGTEKVILEQNDWSEERSLNPYAVFDKPPARIEVTPNIGRSGRTVIAVTAINLTPNKPGIVLRCDGLVVSGRLSSDAAGRVMTNFTIPNAAKTGSRIVEISDGQFIARTSLQINDQLAITRIERLIQSATDNRIVRVPVVKTVWRAQSILNRKDPIAQTFSFNQNRVISAIGLQFTQKDPQIPVTIQIRGVTTGLPNDMVLAEKVIIPSDITIGSETKVIFNDPFYADANTSYALVLLTNSTAYKVRTATLGKPGRYGIITAQTYAAGVLLESANAQTWTPLNGSDLAMRIYGYDFKYQGILQFKPLNGIQFSDINIDEYSALPEGTGLIWEYSINGGTSWDALVPAEEEHLPNLATNLRIRVRFGSGMQNDTPALNFKDVNLIGYLNKTTGTYLTRENELTQCVESTKVYTQMYVPSGTTVQWFTTNDGENTWEAMTVEATRPLNSTWTEYTLARTFRNPAGSRIRYKAVMTGTALSYPKIHTLGATLS